MIFTWKQDTIIFSLFYYDNSSLHKNLINFMYLIKSELTIVRRILKFGFFKRKFQIFIDRKYRSVLFYVENFFFLLRFYCHQRQSHWMLIINNLLPDKWGTLEAINYASSKIDHRRQKPPWFYAFMKFDKAQVLEEKNDCNRCLNRILFYCRFAVRISDWYCFIVYNYLNHGIVSQLLYEHLTKTLCFSFHAFVSISNSN